MEKRVKKRVDKQSKQRCGHSQPNIIISQGKKIPFRRKREFNG